MIICSDLVQHEFNYRTIIVTYFGMLLTEVCCGECY